MKPPQPIPGFDPAEVAFNAEAVRAYLFATALHVLEQMQTDGVKQGDLAIINGSIEFAAQLWMWTALRSGHVTRQKARETAEKLFRRFLIQHMNTTDQPQEKAS